MAERADGGDAGDEDLADDDFDEDEDFDEEDLEDEDDFDDDDELEDDDLEDDDELDEDDVEDFADDGDEELEAGRPSGGDTGAAGTGSAYDAGYEPGDVNTVGAAAAGARRSRGSAGELSVGVLTYLARSMADDPDAVVVRTEHRRGTTVLRLHVAPGDMGRVIGRRGRTAQAIRTLVGVAGAREGIQPTVDIDDD